MQKNKNNNQTEILKYACHSIYCEACIRLYSNDERQKHVSLLIAVNIICCCDCNRRSDTSPTVTTAVCFVLGRHLRNHIIHLTINNYCPLCYYLPVIWCWSLTSSLQAPGFVTFMNGKSILSKSHRQRVSSPERIKHKAQILEIIIDYKLLRLWMWIQANTPHSQI